MFQLSLGKYKIFCQSVGLPGLYYEYKARALFAEEIDLDATSEICFFALANRDADWPFLVIAQSYGPAGSVFDPGALLVEETDRLFIGAGERLLAYDLSVPARLWEDRTDCGFWCWTRCDDVVVMSAELELAAWDSTGTKLWTTFVEPPWSYKVESGIVALDVMGKISRFDRRTDPR